CVMVLFGTGYMWNIKRGWDGAWNTTAAIDGNDPNIRNKGAQHGDETYLIVGTDSRFGTNAQIGGGDTTTIEGIRSDTILLVNIPADRSRVVAVSWPRDLQVDRPDCAEWDPATGAFGAEIPAAEGVKLNSVYAVGGPPCLVKTLTKMSGLNINHFIAMDFAGFEKVVNAIGGVYVCSTVPLYDYELGYILRRPGTQKLTGKRALNYVRARNISAEGNGDYGRIKRQQLFMSALLRSTLSSDVLTNPTKLNKIVNTFIQYSTVDGVDTDSLIQLANSMQGVDAGRVTFLTIPTQGTSVDGENNEIPRTADIDTIFNAIIEDKPLPGEKRQPATENTDAGAATTAAAAPTLGQTDATAQYPANVSVRVLNGSGQTGVARSVMDRMISYGFNVPGIADASNNRPDTVVRYGPGEKDSAATIAKMFPGARIQEDRTVKAGVEVILGADYAGSSAIESPPTPGSTISAGQLPKANSNSDLPNDLAVTNAGDTTCS
ncbi:MAG: LCP family protein, partial [Gordonia sp. (in: high G+C Gram-positive bacteria)]|uniref:LCP family protein n=1 Tax=Gordonia sp. (in: high G+C Gram-positive bacteria) TaxID=84139 RepID=UPI003BB5ED55